jgi:pantetheine-phosphate adenylyltransferase
MSVRAICPGTFDPVHYGHLDIFERASKLFDEVIVAVYDHGQPIKKVLFSAENRVRLINENIATLSNVRVMTYSGMTADFASQVGAKAIIRGLRIFSDFEFEFRMSLITHRLSPEIEYLTLMTREEHMFLSGTMVREIASLNGDIHSMVPRNVEAALRAKYQ